MSISINICRITPDRQYLEFNVSTSTGRTFDNLYIWPYTSEAIWTAGSGTLDLGSHFAKVNNNEVMRIVLSDISLSGGSLYYLQFTDSNGDYANVVVADLSQVFYYKVRLLTEHPEDVSAVTNNDKLFELYSYENCFKLAISLERWEDTNYYYSLITNLISQ